MYFIGTTILGILLLLTDIRIVSLLAITLLLSVLLPIKAKSFGIISRLVVSFLIITCVQQIIALGFWKLRIDYTYFWSIATIALPIFLFVLLKKNVTFHKISFSRSELVATLVATVSVLIIGASILSGGTPTQRAIQFISRGFDNSTHLSLVLSTYQNQGYAYGTFEEIKNVFPYEALLAYPQGWHLITSNIWSAFDQNISVESITKLLFYYTVSVLAWYFLLIFLVTATIINFLEKFKRNTSSLFDFIGIFALVGFLQIGFLVALLLNGFINYTALLTYLLALIYLLTETYYGSIRRRDFLLLGAILSAGISLTWLLAAPIGYLVTLIPFIYGIVSKNTLRVIRKNGVVLLATAIILCSTLAQIYLQIKYSVVPNNINAQGGVWKTNTLFFAGIYSALLGVVIYGKLSKKLLYSILIPVFSSCALAGLIYMYQYHSAAKISYYSDKVNLIPILIISIVVGAYIINKLGDLCKEKGYLAGSIVLLTIVFALPLAFGINTSDSRFTLGGDRKLSAYTASQIESLINEKKAYENNVFVAKDLDYEEDIVTTHFLDTLARRQTVCSSEIFWAQISKNSAQFTNTIDRCAGEKNAARYYIFASSKNFDELNARLASNPNITVILTN